MNSNFLPRTYEDYIEIKTIQSINIIEKKDIIDFLKYTYIDNLKACKFNLNECPRWSIISGYYSMHDISKLYLAIKYDIKFTKPSVHDAVIKALKRLVKKHEISVFIDKADKEFSKIQRLDYHLSKGKSNREKVQYYTLNNLSEKEIIKIAVNFHEDIVLPYIKIIEDLIKLENNVEEKERGVI